MEGLEASCKDNKEDRQRRSMKAMEGLEASRKGGGEEEEKAQIDARKKL